MIRLTLIDERSDIYINPIFIRTFKIKTRYDGMPYTEIEMMDSRPYQYHVVESPSEILNRIKSAAACPDCGDIHHPVPEKNRIKKESEGITAFGDKLKEARVSKHMSQQDLASATGLTEREIHKLESGDLLPKDIATFKKMTEALGTTVDRLLDDFTEFILKAGSLYGTRGYRQAVECVESIKSLECDADDFGIIKDAMMQAFWDAKWHNKQQMLLHSRVPHQYKNKEKHT